MSEITLIGIDTAKSVFHLVGVDKRGRFCMRRRLSRGQLLKFMARQAPVRVVMEACGGSHHWGRCFKAQGHEVDLIAPQFVKPYRRGQKNDYRDGEAICVAALSPGMRYVGVKHEEQQSVEALHRIRERVVVERVALANQLRGLLVEYGHIFARGDAALRRGVRELLGEGKLIEPLASAVGELVEELGVRIERAKRCEGRIKAWSALCPCAKALEAELGGVGVLTASALVAKVADPLVFHNGRQFSAYLGLVARQNTTGGRARLGPITKAGDGYLRKLLIHGARSVLRHLGDKQDAQSQWLRGVLERRGYNKACVALANRNARRAWAIMARHASGAAAA